MGASSMEKVMRLPELLAYIIEILRKDRAALLACSLTCSTWHAASRPYIYYSISLDSYAKCTKLQILIDELPIIGRWVRKLKIVGHYNDLGWIPTFPLVLCDQLRRLHTITFQNVRFSQLYLDPEWVTASGFAYFRRLRTLKFLDGCQLKDPELRSIICSVRNLRNLTLDGVILRAAPQESFSQLFTPNVTSVRIGLFCDLANNGFDTWLTNAGSSHHIRSLVLQVPAFGSSMDWRAFGPALESLAIYDSQSILRHYTFFSDVCADLR
ncbi:unnamed protein product [Somion occarium]|uniref:F-box domain-containing protein n=1 Tax=Somion occarium TaxID=3059160 RepID=A0ABP1D570_9APHY